ncbi:MAG TPA: Gfo/Idh/MocA family oxidoreductase [candidate division WOR-3 bacterium]|uniref:Gfo/Idh/MocA family oxidoreductase n=1 Tax=candidate division WOR-3 bacterium TaxID=2052148 RepID=A0A7V0XFG3_UNCW3|nr:Gfo/Idh/MocA family oxidoreductase [candidate division WOR-3 bacterium]
MAVAKEDNPRSTPVEMKSHGIRVALAGVGRWGANYLHTLTDVPGCSLVGIAETDPAHARALSDGHPQPVYADVEELIERTAPDAFIIATPDFTHADLARAALESGCDVLVEKPMALATADALALETLAANKNRVLAVGQTSLYHPAFHKARSELARRAIGQPLRARNIRTSRGIPGSDLLWDLAPHSVAVALCLFGEPSKAAASRDGDTALLRLNFPEVEYEARLEWSPGPTKRRLTIEGTEGTLQVDEAYLPPNRTPPLTLLCRDFISACRTRRPPLADARLGVQVVACIEAAIAGRDLAPCPAETMACAPTFP